MIKQRLQRSEGWLGGIGAAVPHAPLGGDAVAQPSVPAVAPVSILTNNSASSSSTQLHVQPSADSAASRFQTLQPHERPRKKLSFRDPEVTGKDGSASALDAHQHLAMLKDQGFCDSIENVDLEVSGEICARFPCHCDVATLLQTKQGFYFVISNRARR